ncbi:hypothetical protein LCGC14_1544440 [marine sediment metagenome]|uniref:Uncharacterized protein n=1 Tax=marine sediment metagenome TaxID=412755 RepID=A0A0F9IS44_9ZZZZ
MNGIALKSRIKVCYKCKEYIRLFPNNLITEKEEKIFSEYHSGHPTQIVNVSEWQNIKEEYTRFRR